VPKVALGSTSMHTHVPSVSVVMSVWNGLPHVHDAVRSILGQTFSDFELIVIDDGSTDGSGAALAGVTDDRLRLYRHPENLGLTKRLNEAIGYARGRYIARMDADDECHPERFARQVAFLDTHPSVGLVGSFCKSVGIDGRVADWVYPTDDAHIRAEMVRRNPFVHSSVMIRACALDAVGRYDESLRYVQDYELWGRLASRFEVANIAEFLVTRHESRGSVTLSDDLAWARFKAHAMAQLSVIRSLRRPLASIWLAEHVLWYVKYSLTRRLSSGSPR
jgi:glycosyltransferase involved in cell wall biosynthesis